MNLDAEKAPVILELLGARKWPNICRRVRDEALEQVPKLPDFQADQQMALRSAHDHFQMVQSRLRTRAGQTIETAQSLKRALKIEKGLHELVQEIVESPLRRIDALGLYVLSEEPVVEEPESA